MAEATLAQEVRIVQLEVQTKESVAKGIVGVVAEGKRVAATVTTDVAYQAADEWRKGCRAKRQEIEAKFKPSKDAAFRTHKEIAALEKEALAPWIEAEELVERAVTGYRVKKEQEAAAAQAKIAAEQKKRADEEQLLRAQTAQDEGRTEEAESILAAPQEPQQAPPAPSAPKLAGSSARTYWKCAIEDSRAPMAMLAKALKALQDKVGVMGETMAVNAAFDVVDSFFSLDEVKVRGFVKTQEKNAVGKIPGVRVYADQKTV